MKLFTWCLITVLSFFACYVVFVIFRANAETITAAKVKITSPLPEFLTHSKLVQGLDFWQPLKDHVLSSTIVQPDITAQAALIYDVSTDTVIFQKNPNKRLPIASLVKITTAIVALESLNPTDTITISKKAANIGENVMGISEGEKYTLEELMYGLVLNSGNDAAEAIAEGSLGTEEKFVAAMNQKAKILGLKDSFYVNPSGLEQDDGSSGEYSTAFDLTVLTKYALSKSLFATVAQTYEHDIPQTSLHKEIYLENQTNLLTTYPGVKGVKTGFTPNSGLCLVTYAENGNHKLIGVVLDSEDRRNDMKELLDYSFKVLGVKLPEH